MLAIFKDLWKRLFSNRYYCHVYRPREGAVEIRCGVRYGLGDVLVEGSEAQRGETIPTLLQEGSAAIGDRELIATQDDALVGLPVRGAFDRWDPSLPKPGETWAVSKGLSLQGLPFTYQAFEALILERVRGYWLHQSAVRMLDQSTGKIVTANARFFGQGIHPRKP